MSSGFLDHWIHSLLLDADATNVPATVHDTARFRYRSIFILFTIIAFQIPTLVLFYY